jgi:Cysteine-rich secretory protein family
VKPEAVNLTEAQKQFFINDHNSIRNTIALGKLKGKWTNFYPAVRMAKMTWDDDLAHLAQLNSMQCKMVIFLLNHLETGTILKVVGP